jgi:hypothetical protein
MAVGFNCLLVHLSLQDASVLEAPALSKAELLPSITTDSSQYTRQQQQAVTAAAIHQKAAEAEAAGAAGVDDNDDDEEEALMLQRLEEDNVSCVPTVSQISH